MKCLITKTRNEDGGIGNKYIIPFTELLRLLPILAFIRESLEHTKQFITSIELHQQVMALDDDNNNVYERYSKWFDNFPKGYDAPEYYIADVPITEDEFEDVCMDVMFTPMKYFHLKNHDYYSNPIEIDNLKNL